MVIDSNVGSTLLLLFVTYNVSVGGKPGACGALWLEVCVVVAVVLEVRERALVAVLLELVLEVNTKVDGPGNFSGA